MRLSARNVLLIATTFTILRCGEPTSQTQDTSGTTTQEQSSSTSGTTSQPVASTPSSTSTTTSSSTMTLKVTSPADGASVSISEEVQGTTPYSGNHYIIVTPESAPARWVQDGPATVTNGVWSGMAQFGEGDKGLNEYFTIRCLATAATLPGGKLAAMPSDAHLSEPVKVKRTR